MLPFYQDPKTLLEDLEAAFTASDSYSSNVWIAWIAWPAVSLHPRI
jgi:hypothetical protein